MNSVNTTLNAFYEMKEKDNHKKQRGRKRISIRYNITRYAENKENFAFLNDTGFDTFVTLYHTLGNFMPVPVGCNCPRGSINSPVRDYRDLTLKCIKNYYYKIEGKWVEKIVGAKQKNDTEETIQTRIDRYKDWLNKFGDWKTFIEKNYLEDFVDNEGEPLELWKGHFENWEKGKYSPASALPETQEQCEEYFKNAAECIKKRTTRMQNAFGEGL